MDYVVYGGVLISALSLLAYATFSMIRRKQRRFQARRFLGMHELRQLFGRNSDCDSDIDIDDFLMIIEQSTEIPRGKLRPEDRLAAELAPEPGWEFDDGTNLLPVVLARRFGGVAKNYEFDDTTTLIDLFSRAKSRETTEEGDMRSDRQ